MPRNSSGTMSLPTGQPVVSGTSISSATHNALAGDLAQEITDSLSRSGKGGMTAPLRTADGSVSAPSHSFTNDTDTGVYLVGDANPAVAVAGTKRQEWTSTGAKVTGTLEATGNTTVGGTLGVTGLATLSAGATASGGNLTVSAANGNLILSAATTQGVAKTGGTLTVGTEDNNQIQFRQNATLVASINSVGFDNGNRPITSVATPTNATDAATKGYVDAQDLVGHPTFVVMIDGVTGALVRVAAGSTTGYAFAQTAAGTYTITKAAGFSTNPMAHATAVHTAGVAVSWTPTSGTVITLKTSDAANHNIVISLFD